jgi:2-polyprenyl-3-methyl-5-hydroxy-6-metoxy-1,4-benzoquinol methylase
MINRDITSYYSQKLTLEKVNGKRILQLGLGDGLIAEALCDIAEEVDVIEGSLELIEKFGINRRFATHYVLFENYAPEKLYDVVVANHVLEHVADPVKIASLACNWLRPGGHAIFTVPCATSYHRRIGVKMGLLSHVQELNSQDLEFGHRRVYKTAELEADLRAAGFSSVEISGYMLKMVSHQQMKDWPRELLDACYEVSLECPAENCSNIFADCIK